jgi:hypothetical protein
MTSKHEAHVADGIKAAEPSQIGLDLVASVARKKLFADLAGEGHEAFVQIGRDHRRGDMSLCRCFRVDGGQGANCVGRFMDDVEDNKGRFRLFSLGPRRVLAGWQVLDGL